MRNVGGTVALVNRDLLLNMVAQLLHQLLLSLFVAGQKKRDLVRRVPVRERDRTVLQAVRCAVIQPLKALVIILFAVKEKDGGASQPSDARSPRSSLPAEGSSSAVPGEREVKPPTGASGASPPQAASAPKQKSAKKQSRHSFTKAGAAVTDRKEKRACFFILNSQFIFICACSRLKACKTVHRKRADENPAGKRAHSLHRSLPYSAYFYFFILIADCE